MTSQLVPRATLPAVATNDDDDTYQIIFATPTKSGTQLRYQCPCGQVHLHGRAKPGDGTTPFRESHCQEPTSPLHGITYRLIEVEPGDPRLAPIRRGRKPLRR